MLIGGQTWTMRLGVNCLAPADFMRPPLLAASHIRPDMCRAECQHTLPTPKSQSNQPPMCLTPSDVGLRQTAVSWAINLPVHVIRRSPSSSIGL